MKKFWVFLICFLGVVFMSCYEEINNDLTIRIDNNSSLDLHISFSPNTFTARNGITYKYNDVNVRKGESVSFIVRFRFKQYYGVVYEDVWIGPVFTDDIQKIIISKMDTRELINEVYINELILRSDGLNKLIIEITDELLSI